MRLLAGCAAAFALLALLPAYAEARCDPEFGCGSSPTSTAPAPTPAAARAPTAAQVAAAQGLHPVSIVKTGDVVSQQGNTTTYRTTTAQMDAGTFAKKVDSVGTGQASRYDARASGQRLTNSSGAGVSGDWYASYVCTGAGCTLSGFVFFADDRETRAAPQPTAPPPPLPTLPPPLIVAAAPAPRASAPLPAVPLAPVAAPAVREVARPPYEPPPPPSRAPAVVTAGIALSQQGDVLGAIEALRGRRIALWMRARVDGSPANVRSWQLVSGELTALGEVSGSGDRPLVVRWDRVSGPRGPFVVNVSVTVDVAGEAPRSASATISVTVRSPALVE